jgi:hypothetical protein
MPIDAIFIRDISCPRCHAASGQPCVTVSGNVAAECHKRRWVAFWQAPRQLDAVARAALVTR